MKTLRQNWWILGLQGLFLLVVGAIGVFDPNVYVKEIVQYLGLILVIFGFLMALFAFLFRKKARYWSFMFGIGILQLGFGFGILANIETSTTIFTYVIGGWAFTIGLIQAVIGLAKHGNRVLNLINAIISVAFGALIVWNPFDTLDALTYIISFYSIILGIMVIYYSFNFRKWSEKRLKDKPKEGQEIDDKNTMDPEKPSD